MEEPRMTMKRALATLPHPKRMNFSRVTKSTASLPARRVHDHVWITVYTSATATRIPTAINMSRLYLSSDMEYSTRKLTYRKAKDTRQSAVT